MNTQTSQLRRGFTLVELLVVIGIIAVLSAILFPVFAKVREKARQTSCLSNEKQLGLAFQEYAQDYDEVLPFGTARVGPGSDRAAGWAGQLYSYVKSAQLFKCPSDSATGPSSYAYNQALTFVYNGYNGNPLVSNFSAPVKTILLTEISDSDSYDITSSSEIASPSADGFDGQTVDISCSSCKYVTGIFPGVAATTTFAKTARHTDGSNFLLADGHVKWLHATNVSPGLAAPSSSTAASGQVSPYNAAGTDAATGTIAATFSPI